MIEGGLAPFETPFFFILIDPSKGSWRQLAAAGPSFFGIYAGLAVPAPPDMRALRESMALPCSAPRGVLQGHSPCAHLCRRSALHPGDFLPDEKVTKESPRGETPLGTPPEGGTLSPPAVPAPPQRTLHKGLKAN